MKKIFTLVTLLAMCIGANAASLKQLRFGFGTPGVEEPQLLGMDISADGKYVCGMVEMGAGYFVCDWRADKLVYGLSDEGDSELRHVNNNGVAIGYDGEEGIVFDINEQLSLLPKPEGYKYILGEDISDDGSVKVGSMIGAGYIGYAAFCKAGGEWEMLPMEFPEGTELGSYAEDGSYAKYVSGDGKIIVGCLGNFGPAMIWRAGEDGKYVADLFTEEYVMLSRTDTEKPYAAMSAYGISNNGKYVVLQVTENSDSSTKYPAVYNTETGEIKFYNEAQNIDEIGMGLLPSNICDDGSFIGIIGKPMFGDMGGFIMKAGETQAEMFVDAFPEFAEYFTLLDMFGAHMPIAMSADGRYIIGYGYTSPDPYDDDVPAYFETYVLDTKDNGSTGIGSIEAASDAVPVDYFNIDGRRNNGMVKGLNIIRMSDGTVRKVVK